MRERWLERRSGHIGRFEGDSRDDDARSQGDLDYARVTRSSWFRALHGKATLRQTCGASAGNLALQALETAQLSCALVKQLHDRNLEKLRLAGRLTDEQEAEIRWILPERSMSEAAASAQDLGVPPFGAAGEAALNYCMRDLGGFSAHGQALRILGKLEPASGRFGADLTREAMFSLLKYPSPYSMASEPGRKAARASETEAPFAIDRLASAPPKCYHDSERDVTDWILEPLSDHDRNLYEPRHGERGRPFRKSFACSVLEIADDVVQALFRLEDAVAAGSVTRERFEARVPQDRCQAPLKHLARKYAEDYGSDAYGGFVVKLFSSDLFARRSHINRVLHFVLRNVGVREEAAFHEPALRYNAALPEDVKEFVDALKEFAKEEPRLHSGIAGAEFYGSRVTAAVFDALKSDPERLLPAPHAACYQREAAEGRAHPLRAVCDYIALLTEAELRLLYAKLYGVAEG